MPDGNHRIRRCLNGSAKLEPSGLFETSDVSFLTLSDSLLARRDWSSCNSRARLVE